MRQKVTELSIASLSEPVTAHSPYGDLAPMQPHLGATTLVLGIGKKQKGVVPSGEGADFEKSFELLMKATRIQYWKSFVYFDPD